VITVCGRPGNGRVRIRNRVGGSLVRYCRMSGLLMQPLLAAGPYGVREIRIQIGAAGSMALRSLLVFPIPSC